MGYIYSTKVYLRNRSGYFCQVLASHGSDILRQAKERIPPFERDDTISEERKRELRARTTLYGREYIKWLDSDLAQLINTLLSRVPMVAIYLP